MASFKDLSEFTDPGFIDMENKLLNGGAVIHVSAEVVINGIRIGEGLYRIGRYIVNENGEIVGRQ